MNNRLRLQKSALSKPASTPATKGFKSRPFQDGVEAREAGLSVSNPFDTRPFGVQTQPELSSLQQENTPDLQEQVGYSFANVNVSLRSASNQNFLQRKLMIGEPGDRYEQEADQVAAQVVNQINIPQPSPTAQGQVVQRDQRQDDPDLENQSDVMGKNVLQLSTALAPPKPYHPNVTLITPGTALAIQRIPDNTALELIDSSYGNPPDVLLSFKRWFMTGYQQDTGSLSQEQFSHQLPPFYRWLDKNFKRWFKMRYVVEVEQCKSELVAKVVPEFYQWLGTNAPLVGTIPLMQPQQPQMTQITSGFVYHVPGTTKLMQVGGNPEELGLVQESTHSQYGIIWTAPMELIADDKDDYQLSETEEDEFSGEDGEMEIETQQNSTPSELPKLTSTQIYMDLFNASSSNLPAQTNAQPQVHTEKFNTLFDKSKRPQDAGPVSITFEQFLNNRNGALHQRPSELSGIVVPTTTKGRKKVPESITGFRSGMSFKKRNKKRNETQADYYRNQGRSDVQKGHIMALELGGPDIPKNIVPQWANWQANGDWREMEKLVLKAAENVYKQSHHYVMFCVQPIYKGEALDPIATFNSKSFPSAFHITAYEIDKTKQEVKGGWKYENTLSAHQDETDDMLMYRQDDKAMRDEGQDSPYDLAKDLGGKQIEKKKKSKN